MSLSSETTTRFVRDIVDRVQKGHVQIPSFQRQLVWKSQQVIELLDSIRRGYPIGTLLLWKKQGTEGVLHIGPLHIPTVATPDAWFVVDGQQRMMALTATLTRPDDKPSVDVYAVWFDLENKEFFYNNGRRSLEAAVPANALGDNSRLLRWARHWPMAKERNDLVDVAFDASSALLGYAVSTYITSTADESEVRELFRRANSSGVKMKESEVFEGKHGGEAGGLEELRRRLADVGFNGTADGDDESTPAGRDERPLLFRCWKAVNNLDPRLTTERSTKPTSESLDATEAAVRKSVALIIEHCRFPSIAFLPYRNVLIPLTRFFSVHPDPSPRTLQLLSWFIWRGALSREHAQLSHPLVESLSAINDSDSEIAAIEWLNTVSPFDGSTFNWGAPWNARAAHTRIGASMLWALLGGARHPIGEALGALFTAAVDTDIPPPIGIFIQRGRGTPRRRRNELRDAAAYEQRGQQQIPETALEALLNNDPDELLRQRLPLLAAYSMAELTMRTGRGATPRRSVDGLRSEAVQP